LSDRFNNLEDTQRALLRAQRRSERYDGLDDAEREWLNASRRAAARRTWLLIAVLVLIGLVLAWVTIEGLPVTRTRATKTTTGTSPPPIPRPMWGAYYAGLVLISIAFGAAVASRLSRRRTVETVEAELQTAIANMREALLRVGILPFLRDILSTRVESSFRSDLLVHDAPGLSEVFDPVYEIPVAATDRLGRLFKRIPGGSIGIAGPRGAGKTTLIRSFCYGSHAPTDSISAMLSAPVEYSAREFVLHLFASLCREVRGHTDDDPSTPYSPDSGRRQAIGVLSIADLLFIGGGLLLIAGLALGMLYIRDIRVDSRLAWASALSLVGIIVVFAAKPTLSTGPKSTATDMGRREWLRTVATRRLQEIHFQQTISSGWTGGAKAPIGVEATITGGATLARVQLGFPEIVAMLRQFLELITLDRKVIIGIDELDKLPSEDKARQFLNEVKAIFGVKGCYYLISVSEEAMASFERRGLPFRDVFDSSFDEVVSVSYLRFSEAQGLLNRRVVFPLQFTCLCYCLSGGLARDLIRAARNVIEAQPVEVGEDEALGENIRLLRPLNIKDSAVRLVGQEVSVKTAATITALKTIDLEPEVSEIVEWGSRVEHCSSVSSELLLEQCEWCLNSGVLQPGSEHDSEFVLSARQTLFRLTRELAGFYYFSATVVEFFEGTVDQQRLRMALGSAAGHESISELAISRQAFAVNPRLAWRTVSNFRRSWGLSVIPFPKVLLWARGVPVGEDPASD
jgi:hypothetical protein